VFRIFALGFLGYCSYSGYQSYRAGYFSLPELPDGAYTVSFDNGLRAIVLDAEVADHGADSNWRYFRNLSVANPDRRYLGVPLEVERWFEDAWSWCKAPTDEDRAMLEQTPEISQKLQNARFEAVCRINVDGTEVLRGLIFSVPRL
jgi:hypothetical protein